MHEQAEKGGCPIAVGSGKPGEHNRTIMPGPWTVLLVEDDETIRALLRLYMARMNLHIFEVNDGMEAIGLAVELEPDLIITDLTMPRMSGIELIKALRANSSEKLKSVPIIAMTGATMVLHQEAKDAGANVILEKPTNHKQIRQTISLFLKEA